MKWENCIESQSWTKLASLALLHIVIRPLIQSLGEVCINFIFHNTVLYVVNWSMESQDVSVCLFLYFGLAFNDSSLRYYYIAA